MFQRILFDGIAEGIFAADGIDGNDLVLFSQRRPRAEA
jgi:hypothetical protein